MSRLPQRRALVLLSGGQDSATCLAWALARYGHVETLGFDYGQRHRVELDCRQRLIDGVRALPWPGQLGPDHMLTVDVLAQLGTGAWVESDGRVALDAGSALVDDQAAWRTPGAHGEEWTHTLSATDGGTGLALHVAPRGARFPEPTAAPGAHYTLQVGTEGKYNAWFLLKYDDAADDAFVLALDGVVQESSEQFSGGQMCTYGTRQVWLWALVTQLELSPGEHTLSLYAAKSGLRIDRVYLSTGEELPPVDARWEPSARA